MNPFIGKEAYDFNAKAIMEDGAVNENFNLKEHLKDSKGIIFFYPHDFTFVCPSEIIAFNNRLNEFASRNTKIVGISVDSHFSHHAWRNTPVNKGGIGEINFPLVSDLSKEISMVYHVLNNDSAAFRATFLIDQAFNIRHFLVNDLPLGRNVDEAIRMIDALDHHNKHGEVCPAGWNKGKSGMNASNQGVADYLTSHAEDL
ncbi:MAG TPA: peroxiredoxin [Candidatus Megaira endosymbiont of Hartmannula sinica]|nr:peroxiredoxin [Candidatus Megaera endosymbiont of Hartmannula sinica]